MITRSARAADIGIFQPPHRSRSNDRMTRDSLGRMAVDNTMRPTRS